MSEVEKLVFERIKDTTYKGYAPGSAEAINYYISSYEELIDVDALCVLLSALMKDQGNRFAAVSAIPPDRKSGRGDE